MPLVKEDGTGVDGANSYATLAELDDFFATRQIENWATQSDATKERCAIEAAEYLDAFYTWKGQKQDEEQDLQWPRSGWVSVPNNVVKAHALLCNEALASPLAPSVSGPEVASESESLSGVGSTSTSYRQGRSEGERKFPLVDKLLTNLITNAPGDGISVGKRVYG